MSASRVLTCRGGARHDLPLFLPVFQPGSAFVPDPEQQRAYAVEGCIVNAFFLYKHRPLRDQFEAGLTLRQHVGVAGVLATDSGAFQGFTRTLYLSNKTIVKFQDAIGADIISPLDLVTPPGDKRSVAEAKLASTNARIREAVPLVKNGLLAGVQQGGKFLDLRRRSVEELMAIGVKYVAIGSLVPFFNKNHDLAFVGAVLRQAREVIGPDIPMHVYGAGDPVELPFMVALGADIFDSSSYGHYAAGGYYMTPFGAVNDAPRANEYACGCPVCATYPDAADVLARKGELAKHNLWTICDVVKRVRVAARAGNLDAMLADTLARHAAWFPDSQLGASWDAL